MFHILFRAMVKEIDMGRLLRFLLHGNKRTLLSSCSFASLLRFGICDRKDLESLVIQGG